MNVLIVALGSHGDVHPFCGLGSALTRRGHRVTVMTNDYFRPLVERTGLTFGHALGTAEQFLSLTLQPQLWQGRHGARWLLKWIGDSLDAVYQPVADFVASNPDTVVVSSSLGLGVRCAQEKLRFPMASVHLQPSILRTTCAPAQLPGLHIPAWFPQSTQRGIWFVIDRLFLDPHIAPALNKFRASISLPPVHRILKSWWHSPDRILGLWPDWFGPLQPDWPPQTQLCGFPLWDEQGHAPMPDQLRKLLDRGDPPIAFTPGSAMRHGQRFFAAAVAACQQLGRPGILLTRHSEQIPALLPDSVIHVPFVPLSDLLPRCAALVHHGGIGTMSQALRAGIPQLVMPLSHDQPDNAARAIKLGVADAIDPSAFTAKNVAAKLNNLLTNQNVRPACILVADRFKNTDGLATAASAVEALARH